MKLLSLALLVGTVCVGQQPEQSFGKPVPMPHYDMQPAQPAPLKCGKYEHVEEWNTCIVLTHPLKECPSKLHCAPDLHVVTEREWQELMARLKKLEKPAPIIRESGPVPNGCRPSTTKPGWYQCDPQQ